MTAITQKNYPYSLSSRKQKRNTRKGITLIEVIIATFILGIGFSSIFAVIQQSTKLLQEARDRTRASQIIQSEMELMRSYTWSDLSGLPEKASFSPQAVFDVNYNKRFQGLRRVTNRNADQYEVAIEVSWQSLWGKDQSETATTWITKGGLNDFYYRSF